MWSTLSAPKLGVGFGGKSVDLAFGTLFVPAEEGSGGAVAYAGGGKGGEEGEKEEETYEEAYEGAYGEGYEDEGEYGSGDNDGRVQEGCTQTPEKEWALVSTWAEASQAMAAGDDKAKPEEEEEGAPIDTTFLNDDDDNGGGGSGGGTGSDSVGAIEEEALLVSGTGTDNNNNNAGHQGGNNNNNDDNNSDNGPFLASKKVEVTNSSNAKVCVTRCFALPRNADAPGEIKKSLTKLAAAAALAYFLFGYYLYSNFSDF
jgi:hypothetical protein